MTDHELYHSARRDPARAVLEGFHALKHALRFGAELEDIVTDDVAALTVLADDLAPDIAQRVAGLATLRTVSPEVLTGLTTLPNPTRVLALARRPVLDTAVLSAGDDRPVLLLDQPRHLGNIGAAVRVAAAADAAGLFTTGPADPWGPAAVRGAAGLQFALPVGRLDDLSSFHATSRRVIAIDPAGDELRGDALPAGALLVFGSERDGISPHVLDRADQRVRIPMRDGVSSLNLATAVAVALYSTARRLT